MKTPSGRRQGRFNSLIIFAVLVIAACAIAGPIYSVHSSRPTVTDPGLSPTDGSGINSARILGPAVSRGISLPLFLPQATPSPSIATFDGTGNTCGAAKAEFNLGNEVCATATNNGGAASRRRITWQDPDGFVRQSTAISTDPQSDNFTIPATPTSTLSNGQVVNNIGKWRVNLVGRSLVTYAVFVVKDPANPTADLSITKNAPSNSQQVAAGANGSFDIYVQNSGPDDAATVSIVDHVPNNTTFVSLLQTAGQSNAEFSCTTVPDGNGNVTCSIDTFTAGTFASFQFIYTVNSGTATGTAITNTVSIASATTNELNNADNSATASASVSGTPSGGTCSVSCPDDITTPANTVDENNQPGAIVHFSPPSGNTECGVIVVDHCNDCFFPQGTTVVTATGTGDSCSFTVTVTPSGSAPTISCPANQTGNADATCQATINVGTASATGMNVTVVGYRSDGQPMYTCDEFGNCTRNSPDAPFSAGTTTITWYAYSHDIAGPYDAQTGDEESHRTGSATCTQTVVVNDVTPPVIAATDSTAPADENCQAAVPDYSSTVSDNCACSSSDTSEACAGHPHIAYTQTPAAGTLVGLGPHTVHIEANDGSSNNNGAGNTTTKDVTFTVNDTTAPMITCPADISTGTDPGVCSAVVDPGTATATDNCDTSPIITGTRSDSQALNAPYPKGTTTITWRATDNDGNYSECTQTVTVADDEAPVITFNGQTPSMWPPNHSYHTFTAANFISSVSDNCDSLSVNDVYITHATSDEAEESLLLGDGTTLNDIVIAGDCKSVRLRAERVNSGNGRVYTIYFKLVDSSGNITTGSAKVYSPKNQGDTPGDDAVQYTVTCP